MEVKNIITYKVEDSAKRIDDILNASNDNFKDNKTIPNRETLTFSNGFYVGVTAIFIDIVDSSNMTDEHKRPVLAKIYRSFISECVAIMNSSIMCKEININGDCVWGIFDTRTKTDIDTALNIAAKLSSLIMILNYKLNKKGYEQIQCGIGIDDGRALMIKAGYSGSGINDVVWMGDVVNSACHLSNKAGRDGRKKTVIGGNIYCNLSEKNKSFFTQFYDYSENSYLYEANIIDIEMDEWYEKNCK